MLIKLFDADDYKALEDVMARALVRAFRTLARDGFLPLQQPAALTPWPRTDAVPPVPEPVIPPPPPTPPPPVPEPVAAVPEPAPPVVEKPPVEVKKPPEVPAKKQRHYLRDLIRSTSERPEGYIHTEEARRIIGGDPEKAVAMLNAWVREKQVPAIILCGTRMTPTKGLPGRLMVSADAIRERNALRIANAQVPPRMRTPVTRAA
jgi:hypothetical protein